MKSRRRWYVLVAAGVFAATGVVVTATHPLWYLSDSGVRSWLMRKVPVGSSLDELKAAAKVEGWRLTNTWSGDAPHADWGGISGATVAWVHLGGRRLVLRRDFDSFWAFDEKDRLVDVRVRRTVNAP